MGGGSQWGVTMEVSQWGCHNGGVTMGVSRWGGHDGGVTMGGSQWGGHSGGPPPVREAVAVQMAEAARHLEPQALQGGRIPGGQRWGPPPRPPLRPQVPLQVPLKPWGGGGLMSPLV